LYIYNLNFEYLCANDEFTPCAGIWVKPPQKLRDTLKPLLDPFRRKAEQRLGLKLSSDSNSAIDLYYDLTEPRDELLGMLTTKKEAQFADRMVSHFGRLAKLIPLIDDLFKIKKKRRAEGGSKMPRYTR